MSEANIRKGGRITVIVLIIDCKALRSGPNSMENHNNLFRHMYCVRTKGV